MDLESNETLRFELRRLKSDGDLVAVADDMRRTGVDSLLICRSSGRIAGVVSEHRVRRLAQPETQIPPRIPVLPGVPFVPAQGAAPTWSSSPEDEGVGAPAG